MSNKQVTLVGGIGDKKSNGGTQWYEQNRIYDSECVATTIPAESNFHPYYLIKGNRGGRMTEGKELYSQESLKRIKANLEASEGGIAPTLTTGCMTSINHNNCILYKENEMEDKKPVNLRIRKLTPRECGRLMGVRDEDITRIVDNPYISKSLAYHLFGDSIVVNHLEAIFKEMVEEK